MRWPDQGAPFTNTAVTFGLCHHPGCSGFEPPLGPPPVTHHLGQPTGRASFSRDLRSRRKAPGAFLLPLPTTHLFLGSEQQGTQAPDSASRACAPWRQTEQPSGSWPRAHTTPTSVAPPELPALPPSSGDHVTA